MALVLTPASILETRMLLTPRQLADAKVERTVLSLTSSVKRQKRLYISLPSFLPRVAYISSLTAMHCKRYKVPRYCEFRTAPIMLHTELRA